jgi:hypothetical protein
LAADVRAPLLVARDTLSDVTVDLFGCDDAVLLIGDIGVIAGPGGT